LPSERGCHHVYAPRDWLSSVLSNNMCPQASPGNRSTVGSSSRSDAAQSGDEDFSLGVRLPDEDSLTMVGPATPVAAPLLQPWAHAAPPPPAPSTPVSSAQRIMSPLKSPGTTFLVFGYYVSIMYASACLSFCAASFVNACTFPLARLGECAG
jgi:hypothetical protein